MLKNIFMDVIPDIWPMLIIILVIVCSLRITYLLTKHKKLQLHKELIALIFIIYVLCLFHVVTLQDNNYCVSNFTPFKEIFRYSIGSDKFKKNVLGNIVLFIPYLEISVLLNAKTKKKKKKSYMMIKLFLCF